MDNLDNVVPYTRVRCIHKECKNSDDDGICRAEFIVIGYPNWGNFCSAYETT